MGLLVCACLQLIPVAMAAAPSRATIWPVAEMAVLVDAAGSETIDSVSRADRAADFSPAPHGLAAGYTRHVHWLRLRVQAPPERHLLLEIQPPYLDDLRLYLPEKEGFRERQGGDLHPLRIREVPSRGLSFAIDFPGAAEEQTLYLRVASSSTSLVMPRLWQMEDFMQVQQTEHLLLGMYYGLLLAMLLFNLWHGHWRHDAAHRAFLLYLLITCLYTPGLNGLVPVYLAPDNPLVGHHWVSAFLFLSIGAAAHFHRRILMIDRKTPVLNAYFVSMIGLAGVGFCVYLLGYFNEAARYLTLASILFPILGIMRATTLWRRGEAGGGLLLLAFVVSLTAYLISVLSLQGVFPGTYLQLFSFQVGALLALLAFNFSLFGRLRNLQRQRDRAIEEARDAHLARDAENLARERQGALLAMLTHELKTPLAVVQLALDKLSGEARVRGHAATSIGDIAAVIDRCSYADRLDQGDIRIESGACPIAECIAECITATGQPHRVRCRFPAQPPVLESDRTLLRTVCANLLDNALKYGAAGTPVDVHVREQAHADGRAGVMIEVANLPGPAGMPDPKRVFQRYHREPAAHALTGSGLGLYLVRQLTGRLGGEIRYLPPDAGGPIRFVLWLPLVCRNEP